MSRHRLYAAPVAVAALAFAVAALGDAAAALLRYDREAIVTGELWRLVSGNVVHLGWSHLGLNLFALAILAALYHNLFRACDWGWALGGGMLATTLGLLLFEPAVEWYVGLSGALHGLFVYGALRELQAARRGAWLLLAAVALKLAWEQAVGPLPGSEAASGGPVLVEAHLYGAIGGLSALIRQASRR